MGVFMRFFVLAIIALFSFTNVFSQIVPNPMFNASPLTGCICDQSIALSTQAEVDAFQCMEVAGNLTISGIDITNLDGLSFLKRVGSLNITQNDNLTNLDGLSSLESITGDNSWGGLSISYNKKLVDINGLSSLHEISGDFIDYAVRIDANAMLKNVDGLSSITRLSHSLMIGGNTSLENVDGLRGLTSIAAVDHEGALVINGNPSLTNIDGLSSFKALSGDYASVSIINNISLLNINGLSSFTSMSGPMTGGISIAINPMLKNIDGLHSLTTINCASGVYISVDDNATLENVDGLSSLTTIQNLRSSHISILRNPMLTRCCGLYPLLRQVQLVTVPSSIVTIEENGATCTIEQILANGSCDSCSGSLTLSSQSEVDAFTCTSIRGDLIITGSDITNLDSLRSLKNIEGSLFITGNAQLINIDGLRSITSVEDMVDISNNTRLINLDGLSSLASVGTRYPDFQDYRSIVISGNPALISIQGLGSLTNTPGSWVIGNNASLPNLDGLESLTQIGGGRSISLSISGNTALTNIDGLSALHSVGGYFLGYIAIEDNPSLTNLNGLSALTRISGGYNAGLIIQRNASLTTVNGLSSFIEIATSQGFIYIQDNPNLINGCALYPILHNRELTGFPLTVTISGNGAGFTEEEILASGLCPGSTIGVQPSQLSITDATGHSMKISFTQAVLIPSGYITLMRAYGSPYPNDVPVDGTAYHVGNTIGSGTLVVGAGPETSLNITSLIPNTNYYFAIFAYYESNEGNDYVTLLPLEGNQRSTNEITPLPPDSTVQASNLLFSDISSNSMVVSFTAPTQEVPDGYLTFMRAFTSPFPEDVPVSGTSNYHVGDIVGHSTVVVGLGPSTSLSIESLIPEMEYFFDVYAYHRPNEGGPIFLISGNPLSGSASTTLSNLDVANRSAPYPNPFTEVVTIPFTIKNENTFVKIIIFDSMGRKIADLTSQSFDPGEHEVRWDRTDNYGSNVTQGIYRYSVITSESKQGIHGTLVVAN